MNRSNGLKQTKLDGFFRRPRNTARVDSTAASVSPGLLSTSYSLVLQTTTTPIETTQQRRQKSSRRERSASPPKSRSSSSGGTSSTDSHPMTAQDYDDRNLQQGGGPPGVIFTAHPHKFLLAVASPLSKASDRQLRYGELSVVLPWSKRNICRGDNNSNCVAWNLIEYMLRHDNTTSSLELQGLLQALLVHFPNAQDSSRFSFSPLRHVIDVSFTPLERQEFFGRVLPWMKRTALDAAVVFGDQGRVPLLRQGQNGRVVFTQAEATALMCCAFFSLFPARSSQSNTYTSHAGEKHMTQRKAFGISSKLAHFNFDSLFCGGSMSSNSPPAECNLGKIRCILQYFIHRCRHAASSSSTSPAYAIEISRVSYAFFPDFLKSEAPLQSIKLFTAGVIEDDRGSLHADFANKVIGGGVLGHGCVQEEIRFVISPELLLSRLVCETLADNESVFMSGCATYSTYTGYASSFKFAGAVDADAAVPGNLRLLPSSRRELVPSSSASSKRASSQPRVPIQDVCVVAMDAIDFSRYDRGPAHQYLASWISREINKAYVSFRGTDSRHAVLPSVRTGPIATGNWGSGAFAGDVELKLLIQWCAASEAVRPVHYYVFNRTDLIDTFPRVQQKLTSENWTVGNVVGGVLRYADARSTGLSLFDFILTLRKDD